LQSASRNLVAVDVDLKRALDISTGRASGRLWKTLSSAEHVDQQRLDFLAVERAGHGNHRHAVQGRRKED